MTVASKGDAAAAFAARLADLNEAIARTKALVTQSQALLQRSSALVRPAAPAERVRPSTDAAFAEFSRLLARSGIRDALAYLVGLSDYRFLGIFRFENGKAAAAVHIDREHPEQLTTAEVPDTATYCCYVRDSAGAFTTADAMRDARLDQHVAREVVQAYCGIPVMDPEGRLLGTLCHYDLVPRDPESLDLPLLLRVASALEQSVQVPAYPAA